MSYSIIVLDVIVVYQIKEKLGSDKDEEVITFYRLILYLLMKTLYLIHVDKWWKFCESFSILIVSNFLVVAYVGKCRMSQDLKQVNFESFVIKYYI